MKGKKEKRDVAKPYKRIDLLKDWNKAKPTAMVEVCTHTNVVDWNCACSYGCNCCDLRYHCNDCNSKLRDKSIPTVKLI